MTTLNYKSLVTKEVSPSIVKMGFRLTSQNADVDKAIKDLAELRRKCKAEILKTHSVDNSSYRQENIEVQPFYTMVTKKKKVGGETEEEAIADFCEMIDECIDDGILTKKDRDDTERS